MSDILTDRKVQPFSVPHSDGDLNSVFTQEGQFTWDDAGRYVAPFSCFPPFRGQSSFEVARGRLVLSPDLLTLLNGDSPADDLQDRLARAIAEKLPATRNGDELVLHADDLSAERAS